MDFLEVARHLIAIDTSPENGTREVTQWLKQMIEPQGFKVRLQEESFNGLEQANILVSMPEVGADAKEDFILQAHLDTVNPGSGVLWVENQLNPFNMMIKNGSLFGLGVADGKLDFLCKLEALTRYKGKSNWKRNPLLVGTYGEEIGMHGMLRFIRKNKINAKMALIGESSGLQMIFAGKGQAVLEIKIPFSESEQKYRIQHDLSESTTTQSRIFNTKNYISDDGNIHEENAIDKIFNYLLQIPDGVVLMEVDAGVSHNTLPFHGVLELDLVSGVADTMVQKLKTFYYELVELKGQFLMFADKEFNPATPNLQIGMIKTSEDHVSLMMTCQFPPIVSEIEYQNWLTKLENVSEKISGQVRVIDYKRPYRTHLDSSLVKGSQQILESMNLNYECVTQSHTSEASLLTRVGVDCICFGAGIRNGNVHTPRESVKIEDVYKAILFYEQAIEKFCLN